MTLSFSTVASLSQVEAKLQQKVVLFESGAPTVRLASSDLQRADRRRVRDCEHHILVPMHNKVRLSFAQLRTTAKWIVGNFQSGRIELGLRPVPTEVAGWIEKSTQYVQNQIAENPFPRVVLDSLCENVMMSRYIGVVRLGASDIGPLDVLLDTTSTERNLVCLAVVRRGENLANTGKLAELVAKKLRARYLG